MSNYNWQKTKWEQYAEIYYKLREGDIVHDKFLEYFQDAVNKKSIVGVLDIGCGGFPITKLLSKKYESNLFLAIDISTESEKIYNNEIINNYDNIKFRKEGILDCLDVFNQVNLFYTYNVFMHLDKKSIECVFQYLKDSSSSIVGVLQEPFSDSELTKIIKDRDYCHNFESYIEQYGFTMKKMHKEGIDGLYYFIT